ncbi:response regulator transcription factor [Paenibacillus sp. Soil787]|uniref:response regulator transcription factor n=1 Tax=Paenibacillus sp. Soil787 TaxID=1736411 RepID=UPI000702F218|nr:helix-turn-helix domain-containing protein [Paenibacillus sp. Soil787]KRF18443.1 hypothetical protein ASG93_10315 [Paenibacillus sp. Soil787]
MKLVLVDDERIVIEHIIGLVPWEKYGYEIVATATNGKSALRICEEKRPQIVIVDIRMPVMDGLQLIQAVSEKQLGIKFIVLSAYEDFSFARQAISLGGVSSYLIKHEIDSDKLLQELNKAKSAWETDEKQRRMLKNEYIKNLVTGMEHNPSVYEIHGMKPLFGLVLIQKDSPFSAGHLTAAQAEPSNTAKWIWDIAKLCSDNGHWQLIGEFSVHEAQVVLLFSQRNKVSGLMREQLRELLSPIHSHLFTAYNRAFSVFYTFPTSDPAALHTSFHQVTEAARHAVFCGREALACAGDLPLPIESASTSGRSIRFDELNESLEQQNIQMMETAVKELFNRICTPKWDLRGLFDLINGLTILVNEPAAKNGMAESDPFDMQVYNPVYQIDDLIDRFTHLLCGRITQMNETSQLSNKMMKALRYIHEHYHEEISIEGVTFAIGISPSYLHQLFKKELDRTFLDYVTEYRIQQAKRILRQEDAKISEVAARIGYRSPQHFTQVFKRVTGILPHQYREVGSRQ